MIVSVALLATLLLLFLRIFARELNHDEEQFIAPSALLLRAGLFPYRDYACFHTPDLTLVLAALLTRTSHLLLAARAFNGTCAALLLGLIFVVALRRFRSLPEERWLLGLACVLILSSNPFFRFTAGRAWNHDLAVLATAAAYLSFVRSGQSKHSWSWLAGCGALVGVALGTRLSFAPMMAPFALAALVFPARGRGRLASLAFYAGGLALALLPVAWFLAAAPRSFFFDNFTYNNSINLLYRQQTVPAEIGFRNKLSFPFQFFLRSPSDVLLIAGFIGFAVLPWRRLGWRQWAKERELTLLLLLLPFLFIGSWAPMPSYRQYYYPFVPFLLLGNIIALARAPTLRPRALQFLALTATVSLIESLFFIPHPLGSYAYARWPVFLTHTTGEAIANAAPPGRILTLAPLYPLEGNREIYPEFATGVFAWRTAALVDPQRRATFRMIASADLAGFLAADPPAAILTGFEHAEFELPLRAYAKAHGYTAKTLPTQGVLWLPRPR